MVMNENGCGKGGIILLKSDVYAHFSVLEITMLANKLVYCLLWSFCLCFIFSLEGGLIWGRGINFTSFSKTLKHVCVCVFLIV